MTTFKRENPDPIYYLKSIKRQLEEFREIATTSESFYGPTIATEVMDDNIDWLDCHIDQLERETPKDKARIHLWWSEDDEAAFDEIDSACDGILHEGGLTRGVFGLDRAVDLPTLWIAAHVDDRNCWSWSEHLTEAAANEALAKIPQSQPEPQQ